MSTETTQRLVDRWIGAMNAHELAAFEGLLADDYEEIGPTGRLSGKAAALRDLADTFRSQPDVKVTVTALAVQDGLAAVEYVMQGTMAEPASTPDGRVIPGTGRRYDMSGCSFVFVEGDRIVAHHLYYDRVLMREQLGLAA